MRELTRQATAVEVVQQAAPLLVPLIENDGLKYLDPVLADYLKPLEGSDRIILGCTHYCLIKDQVRSKTQAIVVSQDEVVPEKLADYLDRHPEIEEGREDGGQRGDAGHDGGRRRGAHKLSSRDIHGTRRHNAPLRGATTDR